MNIYITRVSPATFGDIDQSSKNLLKLYGGMDVISNSILKMAQLYPQHTFYYNGTNNLGSLLHKPKNLIDLNKRIKDTFATNAKTQEEKSEALCKHTLEYLRVYDIKFDAFFLFCNRIMDSTIELYKGYISPKTGQKRKKLNAALCYNYVYVPLNYSDAPIYAVSDDVSCFVYPQDLRLPTRWITQCNNTVNVKHYTSIDTIETFPVKVEYKPIELLFLQFKKKIDWRNRERTNDFEIFCNCSSDNTTFRYDYINNWVLKYRKDQVIYGRWFKKNGDFNTCVRQGARKENFKQLPMCDMEDLLFNTKYTLVIPLSNKYKNFLTQKVYSMMYYGIIPFWCKNDYDTDNIYKDIPDYIKVESPEELYAKIDELNNDKEKYQLILNQIYDCLKDEYFSDDLVYNLFDDILK